MKEGRRGQLKMWLALNNHATRRRRVLNLACLLLLLISQRNITILFPVCTCSHSKIGFSFCLLLLVSGHPMYNDWFFGIKFKSWIYKSTQIWFLTGQPNSGDWEVIRVWNWGLEVIRVCILHQSYNSIWISCTNHSIWVLFTCEWCQGSMGLCTKNDINQIFWACLLSIMVCGLCKSLID